MFVRAANPIWFMVDHVGQPLNDEYYAFFLTNTLPYLPQNVYRDPQGMTVWTGDIVQFSPAGTLPDNLYFDPALVYRIEIRHGNSQMDELIWEINNFVPTDDQVISNESIVSNENLISNPQFAFINFVSPLSISSSGTYNIAPGWDLVLTGSGTSTITQEITAGTDNTGLPPGNPTPPYYLKITNNGWSTAILRQRFLKNGELFNNGAITMSVTARAEIASETISLTYSPENPPGTPKLVASANLTTGNFQIVGGVINTTQSTNSNENNITYTDMLITLPTIGTVDISNVQFIGQITPLDDPTTALVTQFQEDSNERQLDHLFHYFQNAVVRQPKSSILAGWTFAYNPWHFRSTTLSNVANNTYTADQTIIIQQAYVTSATANNVQVGRAGAADNFNFLIKAVTATNKIMMLQYIDPAIMRPYWNQTLSVMMRASITTSNATELKFKVRLMYKANLPGTVSQTNPVSVWANTDDAIPTISGDGWTFIESNNDPTYTLTDEIQNFNFDGFQLPVSSTSDMTLGVAFIMMNNMVQTGTPDVINIESVSLVHNDFAIQADAETYAEAYRKCQYYFEYSYNPESAIGLNTYVGAVTTQTPLVSATLPGLQSFFKSLKRGNPTITWYSPQTGAANKVYDQTAASDLTVTATTSNGANITGYPSISGNVPDQHTVAGHWTADNRLGI